MDDVKRMFRAVINGQSALKQELLSEIKKVRDELKAFQKETREGFKEVNDRLGKQGKSLAYLEDDTSTIKEFEKLEKRVFKLENSVVRN